MPMMKRLLLGGLVALGTVPGSTVVLGAGEPGSGEAPAAAPVAVDQRQFLDTYCVRCHNERRKANYANLAFDSLDLERLGADAATWEKAIRKLRVGAMPPAGLPRPSAEAYEAFIVSLEQGLDRAAAAAPDPGRSSIHRLNRLQYANAIRDLFGIEIDERSMLPADNTNYGFDTIGDVLTMSPLLLDRYLIAATKISRLVVPQGEVRPSVSSYDLPYLSLGQDERMSESLPFGSRGGISVSHYFPADGEYSVTLFLQMTGLAGGSIPRGLDVPSRVDVRLDRERVKVFTIGGLEKIPGSSNDAPKVYQGVGDGYDPQVGLEARFPAQAGTHVVGVTFDRDLWEMEGLGVSRLPLTSTSYSHGRLTDPKFGRVDTGLDRMDIAGPLGSVVPSERERAGIFLCRPTTVDDEEPCARRTLQRLARLAYRRPVTEADIAPLLKFYRRGRADGSFDTGMGAAIERMLVDVNFLFRLERDPAGAQSGDVYRISDLDLASRLSFFLWSSIPDDELLDVAARGVLHTPRVLEQQVQRMLADPRAAALIESFFGQWLTTRNVESHRPDTKVYPHFDDNLREAFGEETRRFLEHQVRADRPALELLSADYTFVNERLARHYGIPGVYGSHFRRVALPDDARGGLLGQASVLTVTSYVDRTSVVVRGKWILETLLGVPPPPPPPSVPPLEDIKIEGTLRQRMELHRKNPVCATCHSTLDPLGFALENFDGVGTYRVLDGGAQVDPSGTLLDGTKFSGPATFREALLRRYDMAILTNLTEKLLTYTLGRGVEARDMPAVRQIIREAAPAQHRWSALVVAIARSAPFQMRRAES